jgi:predicted phage tail protein
MMAGGVIQMLTTAAGLASKQDADNKASYAFGSVTNTPLRDIRCLGYGKRRIGGAIISAGFTLKTSNKNTSI